MRQTVERMNWDVVTIGQLLLSLTIGIGLAAAVGLRVFLPLFVLGCSARLGWMPVDADFSWIASTSGLVTLGIATLIEIAAYYIPIVDNALDVIAGPVAFVAGAISLAAVTTEWPASLRWSLALVAGGGTAGIVQGLTTLARLKSVGLTGGVANPLVATVELLGAGVVAVLAIVAPLLAIALVFGIVLLLRRARRALSPNSLPRSDRR